MDLLEAEPPLLSAAGGRVGRLVDHVPQDAEQAAHTGPLRTIHDELGHEAPLAAVGLATDGDVVVGVIPPTPDLHEVGAVGDHRHVLLFCELEGRSDVSALLDELHELRVPPRFDAPDGHERPIAETVAAEDRGPGLGEPDEEHDLLAGDRPIQGHCVMHEMVVDRQVPAQGLEGTRLLIAVDGVVLVEVPEGIRSDDEVLGIVERVVGQALRPDLDHRSGLGRTDVHRHLGLPERQHSPGQVALAFGSRLEIRRRICRLGLDHSHRSIVIHTAVAHVRTLSSKARFWRVTPTMSREDTLPYKT